MTRDKPGALKPRCCHSKLQQFSKRVVDIDELAVRQGGQAVSQFVGVKTTSFVVKPRSIPSIFSPGSRLNLQLCPLALG